VGSGQMWRAPSPPLAVPGPDSPAGRHSYPPGTRHLGCKRHPSKPVQAASQPSRIGHQPWRPRVMDSVRGEGVQSRGETPAAHGRQLGGRRLSIQVVQLPSREIMPCTQPRASLETSRCDERSSSVSVRFYAMEKLSWFSQGRLPPAADPPAVWPSSDMPAAVWRSHSSAARQGRRRSGLRACAKKRSRQAIQLGGVGALIEADRPAQQGNSGRKLKPAASAPASRLGGSRVCARLERVSKAGPGPLPKPSRSRPRARAQSAGQPAAGGAITPRRPSGAVVHGIRQLAIHCRAAPGRCRCLRWPHCPRPEWLLSRVCSARRRGGVAYPHREIEAHQPAGDSALVAGSRLANKAAMGHTPQPSRGTNAEAALAAARRQCRLTAAGQRAPAAPGPGDRTSATVKPGRRALVSQRR